jgi:hypothetical protein
LPQHIGESVRQSADGNRAETLAVVKLQAALRDTAETVRFSKIASNTGVRSPRELMTPAPGGRRLLFQRSRVS